MHPGANTEQSITPFDFHGHQVRVLTGADGNPWWVAAEVAGVLGYSATAAMTRSLDEDEKGVQILHTPGGDQEMTLITESGLYAAILKSRVPSAADFRRWVTRDVLPSIRRTGAYSTPAPVAALPDRRALAQMVLEAEDRADKATAELEAAAPAIEYHDRFIADDQDVITVEDWGRQWGLSRPQAFALLTERKVIFRKVATREFSNKAGQVVDRNEYRPYSDYRNLFDLRPQHNAPRYHNGQVRQTLYVKASASFLLANAMKLPGTPGGEQASA